MPVNISGGSSPEKSSRAGMPPKPRRQPSAVFDNRKPFAGGVGQEHECRDRFVDGGEFRARHSRSMSVIIFPLTTTNVSPSSKCAGIVERAAGAENFRLFNVVELDAELAAVAQSPRTDSGR